MKNNMKRKRLIIAGIGCVIIAGSVSASLLDQIRKAEYQVGIESDEELPLSDRIENIEKVLGLEDGNLNINQRVETITTTIGIVENETGVVDNSSDTEQTLNDLMAEISMIVNAGSSTVTEDTYKSVEDGTEALENETEVQGTAVEELGERPEYNALDYVIIGTYRGLMAEVTKIDISEEDIEEEMSSDLKMAIEKKDLFEKVREGTVADGDTVNIYCDGRIDGVAVVLPGAGNRDLKIGFGNDFPDFSEQLVGMTVGDTINVIVTIPEYYPIYTGKTADYSVTINYIRKLPETTDELINKATDGKYETIKDYLAYEKKKLTDQAEESRKSEAFNELMTQLFNSFTFISVPEDLIDYSFIDARNQYIQMAHEYGTTYEALIKAYSVDQTTFEDNLKDDIETSLKQEMILIAIAEKEGIVLSEDEYTEGVQRYAEEYEYDSVESFEEVYSKSDIKTSLLMRKVMEFVYEHAVITEVETRENIDMTEQMTEW